MNHVRTIVRCIGFHGKVLLRGLAKSLYGAAVAGLMGLAGYGFAAIPDEGGYRAVWDFIAAVSVTVIALGFMYAFGCSRKKGRTYHW